MKVGAKVRVHNQDGIVKKVDNGAVLVQFSPTCCGWYLKGELKK